MAMQIIANRSEASNAIRSDLGAIFVSLELSRSTWLITSLSPGGGEKMSKHSVPAGDICALLARFSEFKQKALARTGRSFPIIVIQEAGLDGFSRPGGFVGIRSRQRAPRPCAGSPSRSSPR
jgi:transposase